MVENKDDHDEELNYVLDSFSYRKDILLMGDLDAHVWIKTKR